MEGKLLKNRYLLERRLGEGGMGVVYKAFDTVEERPVAIKIAGLSSYHESSARFQREAQAMLGLQHPNIVDIYETGEESGLSFIVMEYLSGRSLREFIPLPIATTVKVAVQIADALQYAHGHGIIHRDIKPENLMVLDSAEEGQDFFIKVMDFGLARRLEDQYQLTESGMLIGTAAYISPEQALGYRVDSRSDLYSLGVVLYEMLVGHSPFRGDSFVGVIYQHLNESPPSPRRYNPRIPTPLEQVILRLLRKDPSERYASAIELMEALRAIQEDTHLLSTTADGQPSEVGIRGLVGGYPLIGRETEFAVLKESVQSSTGGRGQLVLISGEPGIGKTRLAQEVLTFARLSGYQVLPATCYELEESFPYQPFAELLRTHSMRSTRHDIPLNNTMQGYAGDLVALVPEMANLLGDAQPPVKLTDPQQERARLFEAIRQFLLSLCRRSPVLLFLDDLQWVDATSLLLLQYIARRTLEHPVLILATYRATEMSRQLSDFLNVMGREKLQRVIDLASLTPENSAMLVHALLGVELIPSAFLDRIHAHTEGNPFFIVETVQHLIEEGLPIARDEEWQNLSTVEPRISAGVREIIERRLAHIPDQTARILAAGAVIGREFSFTLLKELSNAADSELFQALDTGLSSGLIRERQQRVEERYDFSHALIREVIYSGLTAARRRSLHQQVGEIIERHSAEHKDKALGELAYHFSHGYDTGRAIEYNFLAGRQAAAVYATEDAYRYFDTALELVEAEGGRDFLVDILEGLGKVAIILGRFDSAVENLERAIQILELHEPKPVSRIVKLHGEISSVYERIGRYDEALRDLEVGLTIAGDIETVESAYLRGQLATIHSRLGDMEKAMEFARQDLAIAERLRDEEEVAQACTILYKLHSLRSDWSNARMFTERALEVWKKRNDIYRLEWNYLNYGAILWSLGHWHEAEENWQKALDISRSIHYAQGIVQNSLNLGYSALRRNDLPKAEALFKEALVLAREIGHTYYVARSTMRLAELNRQKSNWAKTMELFAEAESILRELGHRTGLSELLWLLADALVEQGDLDASERAALEAITLAPQPDGYEEIGNASLCLAKVHLARGDRRRARELLDQGIECMEKLGDTYQKALASTLLATFLAMELDPEPNRVLSLLNAALSDFRKLGALPDAARVDAILHDLRGRSAG